MNDDRTKIATEMECLYRMIKSFPVASLRDLLRLTGCSEKKVRYHLDFFLSYGIAENFDCDGRNINDWLYWVTASNMEFVESRFPTPFDFFYDANITFAWDGED